jgi:hypothetical protein
MNIGAMEFAPVSAPEPAVFGMAGIGLVALIAIKRRAWLR